MTKFLCQGCGVEILAEGSCATCRVIDEAVAIASSEQAEYTAARVNDPPPILDWLRRKHGKK